MLSPASKNALAQAIAAELEHGRSVFCNFDPTLMDFFPKKRYAYRPGDYIGHLLLVGRTDLIEKFGERNWSSGLLTTRHEIALSG